uniref:Uncharacterized protein n=1 Tax=Cacopsylla melanoneura TaxID=428564 RepID=A0A8D8ZI05_9HEMI
MIQLYCFPLYKNPIITDFCEYATDSRVHTETGTTSCQLSYKSLTTSNFSGYRRIGNQVYSEHGLHAYVIRRVTSMCNGHVLVGCCCYSGISFSPMVMAR